MNIALETAYPTPVSSSALLPLLLLSLARQRHSPDSSTVIKTEYDYVIVGAGSAGSVVASRLSEEPCVRVLLLEAGPKPPLLSDVPAFSRFFWFSDIDWQFKTVPQKHTARSHVNKQIPWTSGKSLGGSSIFNGNLYVRGNRRIYDDWAAQGAKGWSYKEVYPYFLKLEDNKDPKFLANGYHTSGGPVTVHQPRYESEIKKPVYRAVTDMGYKFVDPNAARQTGFYDLQGTLRDNQRCSAAKAYLVPAENRTNLDILPNAMATKILISKGQARGVQFDFRGRTYEVTAKKEVIVSAGTVKTPQLLMLSGIGPKEELLRLNIPCEADLPVGRNLQDHGTVFSTFAMDPRIPDFGEKLSDTDNIQQYIKNRTGPLASTSAMSYMAFLKGQEVHPKVDLPNYQLYLGEITTDSLRNTFGLKPEVFRKLYGRYEDKPLLLCMISALQPKSRGTVTLKSKSPYDSPVIDPNYLADPRDVEDLVQGLKTCQRIATRRPLRKAGVRPLETLIPGCEKYVHDEDRYFRCQVKSIFITLHHPAGTAKMGDPWDPTTVVDPDLRVKNVKGLRVIDASVMPIVTSGNTNIPTIMIAEKASDIIRKTIQCYGENKKRPYEPTDEKDWSEEDKTWKSEKEWKSLEDKPKDEESWGREKEWKSPEDEPKEYEESWEREKEWKSPEDELTEDEESWQDKKQWEKPEDKESIWVEEEKYTYVPKKKSYEYKTSEKEKLPSPIVQVPWSKIQGGSEYDYLDTHPKKDSWAEAGDTQYPDNYKVSKSVEELVKLADKYPSKDHPNDSENKKSEKEKLPSPIVQVSWSKIQGGSEYDYLDTHPKKDSWAEAGDKQYPDNYKVSKSVEELVKLADKYPSKDHPKDSENSKTSKLYPDNYSKGSVPYSWYKKQTELLLKEINQPGLSKEDEPHTPWKGPDNYKFSKSIEELVKLADKAYQN